ncbi:hypothetical protein M0657_009850 [Pyricularia oryzae]|nr:hypothetical protein M0657_009850 [Pyricularia oryzae]
MSSSICKQHPISCKFGKKRAECSMRIKGIYEFCARLVHQNSMALFMQKLESVIEPWSILLGQTRLSCETPSSDPRVFSVLKVLDAVIANGDDRLLSRLAQAHLARVLDILEARVAMERQNGHLHRRNGYRNASIVLDIYMSAQDVVLPRRTLIERKRVAKRWSELAGAWPLFLLVYSEEAEEIIQHRNLPDNAMIRLIASRVFAESPSQLFETCEYWTQAVEAAVVANRPIDNRVMGSLRTETRRWERVAQ